MDSDQGKLFIGGISWETSEEKLSDYFGNYGEVLLTSVMRDKSTGKPRGFGFVVFADPSVLDTVLQDKHIIDGRMVEAKKAMSREEQQVSKAGNPNPGRNFGGGDVRTKKIFVGGLPPTLSEDDFRQYFESYGPVTDVVVMYDQQTNRPRGFGFISFDSEDAVDRVLHKNFHDLNGKQVEVKKALPRDSNSGGGGGRTMVGGASRGGGGYESYGASGGNASSYEGRDSSRYTQSQNTSSGFPSYGSSGYGASSNWYGPGGNGAGSGGYGAGSGGYGSYGGANPGYGGPSGASYGNPNVPNTGYGSYGSGPAGASRNVYGAHASSGYGNTQWDASGGSNGGPGGAPVSAPTGQSPSGAAAYGNQGYGYGGYGGTDGSYGNPAAYGAVGGRPGGAPNSSSSAAGGELQSSGGGYMGGNYGDQSGNSGYGSQGWRSEPSQGTGSYGAPSAGQVGYGGGYGAQQQ